MDINLNKISTLFKNELNIDNDELLYYCKTNPALIFSEISKYLINKINIAQIKHL